MSEYNIVRRVLNSNFLLLLILSVSVFSPRYGYSCGGPDQHREVLQSSDGTVGVQTEAQ